MPSTLTIIRQRKHRRDRSHHSTAQRSGRAVFAFGFIISAVLVVLILIAVWAYSDLTSGLPPVEELLILLNPQDGLLLQPTRIYDRNDQQLLATLAPTDAPRSYTAYSQFPKSLIDATIALADPGFWDQPGYVLDGWRDPETHPTLAQKLVSDLLLWDDPPSLRRAIRERLLAAQITDRYGRPQMLEWYLNCADYGHYAYGVEAAAQLYFGKRATDLDLSESALLAAVSQAPALNPLDAPQAAEQRRLEAIQTMLSLGMISSGQAAQVSSALHLSVSEGSVGSGNSLAPAFTNLVVGGLDKAFGHGRSTRGGLTVTTSLDYDLQLQTACTVQTQLRRLAGDISDILAANGSACAAAALLPNLPPGAALSDASASALILDPASGQVLAAVGDVGGGQVGAHLQPHPAGTLVTPFIYLTGFTRGLSPASLGWDIPGRIANFDGQYHGPVRLRVALANDYLPPAARVLDQMSVESVQQIASPFGLSLPPGLLQEDFSISPLEVAAAYSVFADQGTLTGLTSVLKVTGGDHSIWADWTNPEKTAVVSPDLAYLMNNILSDDVARWPSLGHPNPFELDRPMAVKLSSTLDRSAAWTVGYTPQRVIVVWLGRAHGETEVSATSPLSAGLWHALMAYAARDLLPEGWEAPTGVLTINVCNPSGMLPTAACPNVVSEVFLTGNEPVQADMLYQTIQVNRETGLLATVFTPLELVGTHVYLVVPPEARRWAEAAGITTPPTTYDTIPIPPTLPDAHITSPAMYAEVHRTVEIKGSAVGTDFSYYRLEYGQGLNPQAWVQIGLDVKTPVDAGQLASWDTSGLDGLYILRLLVVHKDQRVEQAVAQVTLDNTPPQVAVTFPQEGQTFSAGADKYIIFQAQVSDPTLAKVDFYVNGRLVGTTTAEPFYILWPVAVGEYKLRVVAIDRLGNQAEANVSFQVKQ